MSDDFPVVSSYGKLSAQFHAGRSRLIEMVRVMSFFVVVVVLFLFQFPVRTII